jgi:hypothetical protein
MLLPCFPRSATIPSKIGAAVDTTGRLSVATIVLLAGVGKAASPGTMWISNAKWADGKFGELATKGTVGSLRGRSNLRSTLFPFHL